jgi:hypothetical protein
MANKRLWTFGSSVLINDNPLDTLFDDANIVIAIRTVWDLNVSKPRHYLYYTKEVSD